MTPLTGSFVAAALVPVALALASGKPGAVVKCREVTGPPAWIVDGRIAEKEPSEGPGPMVVDGRTIAPADVDSISVACSRESHRVFGIEPGRDVVFVWTNAAAPTALRASVESIVPLQSAYLARHGVFAPSLAGLRWRDRSGSIAVRLCVSEDGREWSALGWQSSPADNPPRVLVRGSSPSSPPASPEPRYSCEVTPVAPS